MNQSLEPKPELKTEVKLYDSELKIMEYLWQCANAAQRVTAKDIAAEMARTVGWSKTTTYTVLKKLCDRGIFHMENSCVTVLISKEEFSAIQSQQFVEENFHGSLPAFIAAFTARRAPTEKELKQIKEMIEHYEEESL